MFFSAHCNTRPCLLSPAVPLLATPGVCVCVCEATRILPVTQDGDLALSHFHWKTTASGYHRCQGGGVGYDAVGSSSCRGWRNLLCLHILPGSLAKMLFCHFADCLPWRPKIKYSMCTLLDSGSYCKLILRWPLGIKFAHEAVEFFGKEVRVSMKMALSVSPFPHFVYMKA